jgi:hypothetical protein
MNARASDTKRVALTNGFGSSKPISEPQNKNTISTTQTKPGK